MNSLNKEFLFDLLFLSFILSLLNSFFFTNFVSSQGIDEVSFDGVIFFTLFFLVLYVFHLLVSSLKYAIARITKNSFPAKLIFFNVLVLLLLGSICFFVKDLTPMFLIFSLLLFNITSYVNKYYTK